MISINSLAVYGFNSDYNDDFKQVYNIDLNSFNHYTFIMDFITNDPNICIHCDYKIICKNNQSFSLINIEKHQSKFIDEMIELIKNNKEKLNIERIYLGGIFFCKFDKDFIKIFNQDTFNKLIHYLNDELKLIFKNDLVYGLYDIENNKKIIFCNENFYFNE